MIRTQYADPSHLASLRETFLRDDVVVLPNLLTDEACAALRVEGERLRPEANRRDFVMPGWGTLRRLGTLGARSLGRLSPLLSTVPAALLPVAQAIGDPEAQSVSHVHEKIAINFVDGPDGEHGWHLDTPPFALVVVLQAPPQGAGGHVELVPNWPHGERDTSAVQADRALGLGDGDAYLLRADRTLHRVAPLRAGHRIVLAIAFKTGEECPESGRSYSLHEGE